MNPIAISGFASIQASRDEWMATLVLVRSDELRVSDPGNQGAHTIMKR